ncbi:MAG: hypothetical protein M1833_005106 [Piccolia ochrophora]|nr:MAG: hypothetical protein M1833_005106 [Piccolia ochrophora]
MSADALGARLRDEVHEETLEEFLRTLRGRHDPSPPPLGIPPLDRLCSSDPTRSSATHAPVLQISGPSCTGKTHLVYYILALTVLPSRFRSVSLPSTKDATAVILDTDSRFCIARLKQCMASYITQHAPGPIPPASTEDFDSYNTDLDHTLRTALMQIHVFRPQSSAALLATLEQLESYLFSATPSHRCAARPLGLVAVDSASAFYWPDKLSAEDDTATALGTAGPPATSSFVKTHQTIVSGLRSLRLRFGCVVVVSSWILGAGSGTEDYAHLPGVWAGFQTMTVKVDKEDVARFGLGMSAEEAVRDRKARQEVVDRGKFVGYVMGERYGGRGRMGMHFCIALNGIVVAD